MRNYTGSCFDLGTKQCVTLAAGPGLYEIHNHVMKTVMPLYAMISGQIPSIIAIWERRGCVFDLAGHQDKRPRVWLSYRWLPLRYTPVLQSMHYIAKSKLEVCEHNFFELHTWFQDKRTLSMASFCVLKSANPTSSGADMFAGSTFAFHWDWRISKMEKKIKECSSTAIWETLVKLFYEFASSSLDVLPLTASN